MQIMRGFIISRQVLATIPNSIEIMRENLKIPHEAQERRYGRWEGFDENGEFYSHRTFVPDDGNFLDIEFVWDDGINSIDISEIVSR